MKLKDLEELVGKCTKCPLHKNRNKTVFGEGPSNAEIFLIGEGPGALEDKKGKPFVGRSGKLLTELLNSTGFQRKSLYITSIVKCKPPENRNPRKKEIEKCTNLYLDKQMKIIKPKAIIPMGLIAIKYIFKKFDIEYLSIGKIHGKVYQRSGRKIIPMYHPAAGLYNPNLKPKMEEDWKELKNQA